ncbi:MAG: hypothetical protein GF315_01890 [candidate division Zixibacteria bacterium]|nr:hypothetical protein [candidate division Zixibacteria bacterium]
MGIWKISNNAPRKIENTKFNQEQLLEGNLEDWITVDPSILGEPLLIVGRQVMFPDIRDKLDLLAIDPQGNSVIIEIKRGRLKDPVDMQALRYASYISKWEFENFENAFMNHLGVRDSSSFNFNAKYEEFCADVGIEEAPDINTDQRIIIVGNSVREKLGSVALWLFEHSIDIKVIEMQAYKDGNDILIEPDVVVPVKVSKFAKIGTIKKEGSPWVKDGKNWHLEKKCSQKTKEMLLKFIEVILDTFEVDIKWNQKFYVAFRVGNYNWCTVGTAVSYLGLRFFVKSNAFTGEELASKLNIAKFDEEESLSEKLALPSSVYVKRENDEKDKIYIRIKEDFNINSQEFLEFLKEAYSAFPKLG